MKQAHFYAYGVIGENDPMFKVFTGEDDPRISSQKIVEFINANADADEFVIHINSRGGSVTEGYAIHDLLQNSGKKVTTIGEGMVASIATVIFLAGTSRKIAQNAELMIHLPWIDPSGQGLTADELQKLSLEMKDVENHMVDFYVDKTGVEKSQIEEMMKAETYLKADQSLELKFATEILSPVKAFAYITQNKMENKNPFAKVEEMFTTIKNMLSGKKAEEVTPPVDPTADAAPIIEDEKDKEINDLKAKLEAAENKNKELETSIETSKQEAEKKDAEIMETVEAMKKEIVTVKAQIKSNYTPTTGDTILNEKNTSPVTNRVEEARRKRAEKKAAATA